VAVKNRKILASSPTMKGLYEKIDKLNPGMVLITRIEKPSLLFPVGFRVEASRCLSTYLLSGRP
jgi:hypothetical protein